MAIFKRLASLKSDFLLLPEYFFIDNNVKDHKTMLEKSQYALEWLQKLNDAYRGVIVGGTVVQKEENDYYSAVPIICDGQVVDWYRKRNLTEDEKTTFTPGAEPGVFILKGFRFAVLAGDDMQNKTYLKELADQHVRLIFAPMASHYDDDKLDTRKMRDEEFYQAPARDYNMHIAKCCATGSKLGKRLQGRSLVVTPPGITWRVSPDEENKEILKTVMLNIPSSSN